MRLAGYKWSTSYFLCLQLARITLLREIAMGTKYHLFSRDRTGKDGKIVRRWYYWYWGEDGVRIKKAAGPNGSAPLLKREAQDYIDQLDAPLVMPGLIPALSSPPASFAPYGAPRTFKAFADTLYLPDSQHLKRKALTDGEPISEDTRTGHRSRLKNYLIPKWGECSWATFAEPGFPDDFTDWLVDLERIPKHKEGTRVPDPVPISNSTRNSLIETMTISLREAKRARLILQVPEFERFNRLSRHQDTLTNEELIKLFPEDPDKLKKIWQLEDGRDLNTGLLFGAMCCLGVSAGLRSGELRAVSADQIIRTRQPDGAMTYGLIVDRALNRNNEIAGLKKANKEDLRVRVVVLSDKTMRILDMYLTSIKHKEGLLFLHRGQPVRKENLGRRWAGGLKQAKIPLKGRRLTPHAMRYTYNTRMRMLLSEQVLQEVVGHRSDAMTALYDRPHLVERLKQLSDQQGAFNKFWGEVKAIT